ncbi:MAG TPA: sigma-70 family RNA polymerase sigma factor [Trinickia sp.]|uniref:RNA polymerase sigma factor n=1 Tax=Trinickia sp. TaxID=2571163 RepID=UPI002CE5FEDD|nr:sigma-70 family RNA polymerase sigma factor [Trinickia sp.]HVW50463.1 sigma-70 family RNA polymerase sigma factor [Trinickia sp.]
MSNKEPRLLWSSAHGRCAPPSMAMYGAQAAIASIDATDPTVVFVDCIDADAQAEVRKWRITHGTAPYLVPVVKTASPQIVVSLIAQGANDVAGDSDLLCPDAIIGRSRDEVRLMHLAKSCAGHTDWLQRSADDISSPVFFKDAAGAYTGCNEAFERRLGRDRQHLTGKTVYDIAPSDLALVYQQADLALASRGGVQIYATGLPKPSGDVGLVRFYKSVISDGTNVTDIVGTVHDIGTSTAKEEIQEALRELLRQAAASGAGSPRADGDRLLLARIARRDAAALARLHRQYAPRLKRFLNRMTWSSHMIDEVVNDVFLVVWNKAVDFRGQSSVSTWLMAIAYRCACQAIRSEHRFADTVPLSYEQHLAALHYVHGYEATDMLTKAMAQLPVDQQLAMSLAYVFGHSTEEIATITHSTESAVKARIRRARERLRAIIGRLD